MAIGDTPNQNLFGTNYNPEDEEEKRARLAAQGAMMGSGDQSFRGATGIQDIAGIQGVPQGGTLDPTQGARDLLIGRQFNRGEPIRISDMGSLIQAPQGVPALDSNIVAQVPGIQNIRNPGAFDPANMEPARPIMSAGTAGRDERTTLSEYVSQGISSGVEGLRDAVGTESVSMEDYRAAQDKQTPSVESALGATQFTSPDSLALPSETVGQVPSANAFSAENAGQVNAMMEAQSLEATQGGATAPPPAQTLSQFMRYEDSPEQRTEQFVDAQGRMRFRPTQEALQLQGQGAVAQPPAAALSSFEQDSLSRQQRIGGTGSYEGDSEAREARVRASDRKPGESQADRDTRIAQSRTTGGQTEGLSFDDARRRAEGQLAERGVKNPSASQVNALARGIQAGEPERLAELETKRAVNEARLKTAQATLDRPEFEGKVYTINGVTFAQTSNGGAQVISTGTETPEEATAKMKDYAFALEQIDKARKAYQAGDIDKANDIFTAAEIQKDGFATNATEYFKDSITPPASKVTDSGLTQQQESGIQNVMATNKITREDAIKALKEAGKLK